MRTQSRRMAFCGVLAGLAAALLALGGVIPAAAFAAPILSMIALLPVQEEYGLKTAATAYAAVSLLGLLLAADRETALVYLFFGWYPLLRPRVAALPSRLLRLAVRLAVCNAAILLLYGLIWRLLGLPEEAGGPPVDRFAADDGQPGVPAYGPGAGADDAALEEEAPAAVLPGVAGTQAGAAAFGGLSPRNIGA